MCQKGKKQGANRRFYRRVVGPELVQEKDNQGRSGGKRVQMGIFFVKRLLYRL